MTEEQILDEVFEGPLTWRGYKLSYCGMCEVYSISCDKCKGGTCSGWGDCSCSEDMEEFFVKAKHPIDYLTNEERETIFKFRQLKKFSEKCFRAGKFEIDWKTLVEEGETSVRDGELFPETKNYKYKNE